MKKARKGFTLVELLIVIGIIGILSAMGLVAGQEATSAARATMIADNLEKLAAAGMMFYEENSDEIDKTGQVGGKPVTHAILAAGINNYLNKDQVQAVTTGTNVYFAQISGSGAAMTWWIGYKFAGTSDGDKQVMRAMKNKVNRMELKKAMTGSNNEYDGTATVYMKIR